MNQLLTIAMITRESMRVLENDLTFTKQIRHDFDNKYAIDGAKIGYTINVRKPPRYVGRTGDALQIEDATETSVPLTLTTKFGVDLAFTTSDMTLSIDDFSERFISPNIATVANKVDYDGMQQFLNVYNEIGTVGTIPNTLLAYSLVGARLDNEATPRDSKRAVCMSALMQAYLVDAVKGLFQDSTDIARQYREGTMGRTIGFKFSMDQNVPTFLTGAGGGTPVVAGGGQQGSSINTSGWTNSTKVLLRGDIITFALTYAVNPQSRQSTGELRQFVVAADVTSGGGGLATIPILGPSGNGIITAGPFQNVSVSPANNAGIVVNGGAAASTSSPRGLGFHKDAFAMGCADLMLVGGVDKCDRVTSKQLGLSIRFIRAYDINQDRLPNRTDILYGHQTLYPELAVRIAS